MDTNVRFPEMANVLEKSQKKWTGSKMKIDEQSKREW